ncbi:MAG: preprotein translocase subunit SecE [Candidatus Omnitrophota bacterium]|nr:MAG: preprotein translocase subunit SecE [Candidatus Omnitrophota bacterium]
MANKLSRFLSEVKSELKKVSWSTKKELIGSTGIVIVTVSLLALFIGVVDFVISRLVNLVIR